VDWDKIDGLRSQFAAAELRHYPTAFDAKGKIL
jgi:hypothetical protein